MDLPFFACANDGRDARPTEKKQNRWRVAHGSTLLCGWMLMDVLSDKVV
jgi:hypothetical protein